MIWLLLSIICSASIASLLKYYNDADEKLPIMVVFFGNYFLATALSAYLALPFPGSISISEIALGSSIGILFIIGFLCYQRNIVVNGISLSVSVMRMSLLIPVLMSILVFKEVLNPLNYAGVIVIIAVFFLMGGKEKRSNYMWLLALFVAIGLSDAGMKVFKVISDKSDPFFLFLVFGSALITSITVVMARRSKIKPKHLIWGLILGIPNQLTSLFFLKSLDVLDATIVYPTFASGVVIVGIATDIFIWKSKIDKRKALFLLIIIIGVILINIR